MTECPACGRKHRPGTLFCRECGVYLPTGSQTGTEPIRSRELPSFALGWEAAQGRGEGERQEIALKIKILSTGRQIEVSCRDGLQLGRVDAVHNVFPDVDLTSDGGLDGGVSRRHCRIYEDGGRYFIEDLGSANGTFLGGERLPPYFPHRLEDGDRLRLGRVEIEVIVRS